MELINNTAFQFANIAGRVNFPHHSLTLIVKATFDLKPGAKAVPAKDQLFPTGDEFAADDEEKTGSVHHESEFAYFKPAADLFLTGTCHAPGGQAVKQCNVTFQVGEKRHTLSVFGNRYWEHTLGGGAISEPRPFVDMPVNYENAFGGKEFVKNPIGKGFAQGNLLPNIEDPNHLIVSTGDKPEPAGFGPLNRLWEQRQCRLGTYTGDYLQKRWPWFPEDFDWRYFNAAPQELQCDGYLRGDEALYFENLHPQYAQYHTQLPGLRIRSFKRTIDPASRQHVFEEVTMNLDTLWVDMEKERLVLAWRGWTEVLSDEFEEISHVFIMSEPVEQAPVTVDQAHEAFKSKLLQLQTEWGTAPEAPPPLVEEVKDELSHEAVKTAAEQAIKEVVAETKATPIDAEVLQAQTEKLLAQLGLDVNSLPAQAKQQIQDQQTKLLQRFTQSDPAKLADMEALELRAQVQAELAKLDIDMNNLPPLSEKAQQEQQRLMQELGIEEQALVGSEELKQFWEVTSALLPKMGLDPEDLSPLLEQAKKQKLAGKLVVKAPPVEAANAKAKTDLREAKNQNVKFRAQQGESFSGEDLSGLDLSDMDLKNVNFSGAWLLGANLQNSDLSGADLRGTKLMRANFTNAKLNSVKMSKADCTNADFSCVECVAGDLSATILVNAKIIGADFSECDLSVADLSAADLSGSKLENADMSAANLSKSLLDNANLFGADLSDAIFEKAHIVNAKLDQITAKDAIFTAANLSNSRLVEAKLHGADFSAAVLTSANLQGADLSEVSLEKVTAVGINLSHAILEKLRASESSDFTGGLFEQAQGKESIWHQACLNGAIFKFAKLPGADFSKASLQNAQFYGADMSFARFMKADLSGAQLLDMNLFKGSLEKAKLTGTVFNGSNLYAVEFLEAHLEKTQVAGANLKATKLQEAV